jgi:hypothetical protein
MPHYAKANMTYAVYKRNGAGSSSRSIDTADVTEQVGQLHIGKQKSQNASLITSDSAEQKYSRGYQQSSPSGQQNTERQRTPSKGI